MNEEEKLAVNNAENNPIKWFVDKMKVEVIGGRNNIFSSRFSAVVNVVKMRWDRKKCLKDSDVEMEKY